MNREEALKIAREVMSGQARSYVSAAHVLAQFLVEEEAAREKLRAASSAPAAAQGGAGGFIMGQEHRTLPYVPEERTTEKELDRPRASAPLPPRVPDAPESPTKVLGVTVEAKEVLLTPPSFERFHEDEGDCG